MLEKGQTMQYYLLAFSNFLAAFGGGMILGKGIGIIDNPFLQNGSLMAFFLGTVLGLIFLQLIPKKFSSRFSRWFSIVGGLTSLILLEIFKHDAVEEKLTGSIAISFFILLSIRFGLWFYSRASRASSVAGQQQRIAWVELGYYGGMIFGLILWKLLDINFGIIIALLIDAGLQFSAGIFDLYANNISKHYQLIPPPPISPSLTSNILYEKKWEWKLASAVILLTVGIQVVIFNLTHQVSALFGTFILASFYMGASIAAFFCNKLNIQLTWKKIPNQTLDYAIIYYEKNGTRKEINILFLGILSACFVIAAIASSNHFLIASTIQEVAFLIFIFFSAFSYEVLALVILDRIGLEATFSRHEGMVIRTYGIMGISAAVSLWLLGLTENFWYSAILTLGVCVLSTGLMLGKRNFISAITH